MIDRVLKLLGLGKKSPPVITETLRVPVTFSLTEKGRFALELYAAGRQPTDEELELMSCDREEFETNLAKLVAVMGHCQCWGVPRPTEGE